MLETLRAWTEFASLDLAPGSMRRYRYWLLRMAADTLVDPRAASGDDLMEWLASFVGSRGRPSVEARSALRHFYAWMCRTDRRPDDPTRALPRARSYRKMPHHLSNEEAARLVAAAWEVSEEWAWSFMFLLGTGARVGEACALVIADVDLEGRSVVFRRTKNGQDRLVYLGPMAYNAVKFLAGGGRDTLLGVKPPAIRARMKKCARIAHLPETKVHPHTLRHTSATLLLERGAHIRQVQERLGHADERMTYWYTHISGDSAKDAANLL